MTNAHSNLPGSMYKHLRIRLTAWYVVLSGITSIFLILAGTWLCHKSITDSLNKTLEELIASNLPQVEVEGGKPRFVFANQKVVNHWAHMQSTLQLYDPHGRLIEEFGAPGVKKIEPTRDYFEAAENGRNVRATSDPIRSSGVIVGYIQAQVPTAVRDKATTEFALFMAMIIPILLLATAVAGYLFSLKASRPVETAYALLRQFMADASHELRTPVHAIQLMAENVAAEGDGNEQLTKDMAGIVRSTDRMARLIDDMMTLTKAELEQLPMQNVTVRLDEVVHEAAEELRPVFKDKGISLSLQNLPRAVVLGDRSSLHRLFSNLLQNALRYTDAGGHVSVNMEVNAFNARVAVVDTGIGISGDDLPRIFDRFYRVDKSRTRAAGGSGLGLSIVKAICEHHKGSVSADSVEGKGSTFTVTLPVSTPLRGSIQKIFALTKP